ncbi:MAG TPA: methionine adenosyltransferase [Mycobacterium sp.]|nr:methionine adenosyltransferase [Mycobacterium sp.]HUH69437.1 methionine adenosyltransferase [Mycobacterium sp.]
MQSLVLSKLDLGDEAVEVVERKGLGHPDTICDALAETLSRNLCREYRERFGRILHHNVDKVLLCAGQAMPAFGGGAIIAPITIYLAGRATAKVGSDIVAIEEIAVEGSRTWMRVNLHGLDPDRNVRFQTRIRPGSQDLQALFSRERQDQPLANDTSIGVGYAPMSTLERLTLGIEKHLNGDDHARAHPARGEDVKVMGIRRGGSLHLTVACAMIGRHLRDIGDYLAEKAAVEQAVLSLMAEHGFESSEVAVNAADDPASGTVYLTVTGTSAEAGDDGEVGRGNRVNGLITPYRPMSLEAAAGKNPVAHVGKIYNVVARDIAEALVAADVGIAAAHCLMVSRIGTPVTRPAVVDLRLATKDGLPIDQLRERVEDTVAAYLARIPQLIDGFVAGTISVV